MRFIQAEDYSMQVKTEVLRVLTDTDFYNSPKLIRAEQTAISQIRKYIGKRYDCDTLLAAEEGERDSFILTVIIDIALYHLYSQTGSKDVPEHRSLRYQDWITWLTEVGKGELLADLPVVTDPDSTETYSEVRLSSYYPRSNHRY